MKTKSILIFALAILCLASCASSTTEKTGKEYTADYICPMHCEGSGSDEAGKCPVCKMDYIRNDAHGHAE